MKKILNGALIALVTAIALRILFTGLEVSTGFALLFLIFMMQIIEDRYASGLSETRRLVLKTIRVGGAVVLFLTLRFLVGQALSLYPSESRILWNRSWGAFDLFWGKAAPIVLIWEILFAIVAGKLMLLWEQKKRGWTGLVNTIFVVSLAIATMQIVFPKTWATVPSLNNWDTDVATTVTTNGGWLKTIKKGFVPKSWSSDSVKTNLVVYKVFLGETNVFIPDSVDIAKIEMATDRFTGWINIPATWKMPQWRADANKGVFVQTFGEDTSTWIAPNETRTIPAVAFRLKGEGTVTLRGR